MLGGIEIGWDPHVELKFSLRNTEDHDAKTAIV
jgi:hypothetical protein